MDRSKSVLRVLRVGLLLALPTFGCGGDKCDDFAAMCQRCGASLERSLCEDYLADLRSGSASGVSASDLCAAGMDAFIGTSCRE